MRFVAWAKYPRKTSFAERCEYSSRKWCSVAQQYLNPARSHAWTYSRSRMSELCSASGSVLRSHGKTGDWTMMPNSIADPLLAVRVHRWFLFRGRPRNLARLDARRAGQLPEFVLVAVCARDGRDERGDQLHATPPARLR